MLNVFTLANGRLFQEEIESRAALAHVEPVWVDLDAPTDEEKGWIATRFGLTIPGDAVGDDLEESARFYEEDNGELHIRSDFLIDDGETAGPLVRRHDLNDVVQIDAVMWQLKISHVDPDSRSRV